MSNCTDELQRIHDSVAVKASEPTDLRFGKYDGCAADISAKDLLCRAAIPVMKENPKGSSTALICLLHGNNQVQIANVGDCRLYLFRTFIYARNTSHVAVYFVSPEQIAQWNAPLQLGPWRFLQNESSLVVDPQQWTEEFTLPIVPGDVLAAVSDGVSDNLFAHEILEVVTKGLNDDCEMEKLAEDIVNAALAKQTDPYAKTPFGNPKPDDTTCVCAKVI
jgi:serine/threonine protein phosphatase PrpC